MFSKPFPVKNSAKPAANGTNVAKSAAEDVALQESTPDDHVLH